MYLDPGTAVLFALFGIPWDAVYVHSWVSVLGIYIILNPDECVSPALVSHHFVFARRDFIKLFKFKISKVSKKEIATKFEGRCKHFQTSELIYDGRSI